MDNLTIPAPEKRISEYEKFGFGMFIHWGLYSQKRSGEWVYWLTDKNMEEYKKLANTFTAADFDAKKIVKIAKNAGCKYITLTTRHHEGFSLYDTRGLCDFDSVHSCGRDLVKEFCDACHEFGIAPFLYHTTIDWYQDDFFNNFDKYLEYLRKSVEILCKYYGKIGGFFFDGNWWNTKADWKLDELYGTIRKYQPDAIIINNTGLGDRGTLSHKEIDAVTFEQGSVHSINLKGAEKYYASEVCMTMNRHWGIADNDFNYKSPAGLIRKLCQARVCGANYLLNIGPTPQGGVNPFQEATMGVIGDWMKIFGEAIYDSQAMPVDDEPICPLEVKIVKSRSEKAYYIYDFILSVSGDKNVTVETGYTGFVGFGNVKEKIKKIEWIDSKEELEFTQGDNGSLAVNLTAYRYGTDYCVRIAKAYLE